MAKKTGEFVRNGGVKVISASIPTHLYLKAVENHISWSRALTLGLNTILNGFSHKVSSDTTISEHTEEIKELHRKISRLSVLYDEALRQIDDLKQEVHNN